MHLRFSGDRHEVCVSLPAWDQVQMDMSRDTRSGDATQVDPHIISFRFQRPVDGRLGIAGGLHQLKGFFCGEFFQGSLVCVGGHHKVADVIGEPIQDGEAGFSPMENQVLPVFFFGNIGAEEAVAVVVLLNVLHPPGCPDGIHFLKDTCGRGQDQTKALVSEQFSQRLREKEGGGDGFSGGSLKFHLFEKKSVNFYGIFPQFEYVRFFSEVKEDGFSLVGVEDSGEDAGQGGAGVGDLFRPDTGDHA